VLADFIVTDEEWVLRTVGVYLADGNFFIFDEIFVLVELVVLRPDAHLLLSLVVIFVLQRGLVFLHFQLAKMMAS